MSGSAPPFATATRLQDGITARALAPSEEARGTPLRPPLYRTNRGPTTLHCGTSRTGFTPANLILVLGRTRLDRIS